MNSLASTILPWES